MDGEESTKISRIEELPVECIVGILSLTSPADACRSATVSKRLHSVADSDIVWETFLPSDYQAIISSATSPVAHSSMKELYFSLSASPILVDMGTKSFSLDDKASGKKCYMIRARELSIALDVCPSWSWIPCSESRFKEAAYASTMLWFDIIGHIETKNLSPDTSYIACVVFRMERNFDIRLKRFVAIVRPGQEGDVEFETKCYTVPFYTGHNLKLWQEVPRSRGNGWMEIEIGSFTIRGDEDEGSLVRMHLKEVNISVSSSGIAVEGIEVRPQV